MIDAERVIGAVAAPINCVSTGPQDRAPTPSGQSWQLIAIEQVDCAGTRRSSTRVSAYRAARAPFEVGSLGWVRVDDHYGS
jgi:hypothetical protein